MIDFKELKVWQKAHQMTLHTYRVTLAFPREQTYGLISQLRRATSSVGANIRKAADAVRTVIGAAFFRSHAVRPARQNTISYWQETCAFSTKKTSKC